MTILAPVDPTIEDEFEQEFDPDPFETARLELILAPFEYDELAGAWTRSAYVGDITILTPSGKYYMPFSCSNVTPCPKCKGKGCDYCGDLGSREAYLDQLWWEEADAWADARDLSVGSGEGAGCDVVIVETRERPI